MVSKEIKDCTNEKMKEIAADLVCTPYKTNLNTKRHNYLFVMRHSFVI